MIMLKFRQPKHLTNIMNKPELLRRKTQMKKIIASNVREAKDQGDYTYKDLAEILGYSEPQLKNMVNKKNPKPTLDLVLALNIQLKISLKRLLGEEDDDFIESVLELARSLQSLDPIRRKDAITLCRHFVDCTNAYKEMLQTN